MRARKTVNTTLGNLIVAVTDQVAPLIRDQGRRHVVVSYILLDLFAHNRVRLRKRPPRRPLQFRAADRA